MAKVTLTRDVFVTYATLLMLLPQWVGDCWSATERSGWMDAVASLPCLFSVLIIPLVFSHPLSFPLSGGVQLWHCIPSKMTPVGGPRFIAMPLYQLHWGGLAILAI